MILKGPRARFDVQMTLERVLTGDDVEALTAYGLARAARGGVTLVAEHLHCPSEVEGGLAAQQRAAERVGVRLIHSHATTSVLGDGTALEQVDANAQHVRRSRTHPLVRGALGFGTSRLCSDPLLERLGALRSELGSGAHFHLAECEDDLTHTFQHYGARIVRRLDRFGLLVPGSVAAYARAIDREESARLSQTRTLLALSPRSAIAGELGTSLEPILVHPNLIGLGTEGSGTLWQEIQCGLPEILRLARGGRLLDPDGLLSELVIGGPAELCSMAFGKPSGVIEPGALADLVVYDHVSFDGPERGPSPHLLLQLGQSPVAWTIVGGRVVVREGQLLGADYLDLATNAAEVLRRVWNRAEETLRSASASPP